MGEQWEQYIWWDVLLKQSIQGHLKWICKLSTKPTKLTSQICWANRRHLVISGFQLCRYSFRFPRGTYSIISCTICPPVKRPNARILIFHHYFHIWKATLTQCLIWSLKKTKKKNTFQTYLSTWTVFVSLSTIRTMTEDLLYLLLYSLYTWQCCDG